MNNFSLLDTDELFALAQLDFEREDYQSALPKLKKLIKGQDFPVGVFSVLGRIYAILGLFNKAKISLETFLEHQPDAVPEHFEIGMIHRQLGDDDSAISVWDDVLEKAPHFPPVLYSKALYLLDCDLTEESLEQLNLIIETANPNDRHIEMANELISQISLQS